MKKLEHLFFEGCFLLDGDMKKLSNQNLLLREMPRERVSNVGFRAMSDQDLLSMIIRSGQKNLGVLEISKKILMKLTLNDLLKVSIKEFCEIPGINQVKACSILAGIELGRRASEGKDPLQIKNSSDVILMLNDLRAHKKEHFVGLYLNARNQIIFREEISVGIINASLIHPRELFEPAIKNYACSIIIAHNHPSGDATPSDTDREITKRLVSAGKILGVEINDHVIISNEGYFSFLDSNLL